MTHRLIGLLAYFVVFSTGMDDHYEKYYLKAVFFLKFRQRSVKEMREYLKKKNTPDHILERVITQLTAEKFLNDAEFARQWMQSRARFKPKGKRIVIMELKQKGITQDVIESVMNEETPDDVPTEQEQLALLVSQKMGKYTGLSRQEIYQKLGAYLGRKGFSWDMIKKSIDHALEKEYN